MVRLSLPVPPSVNSLSGRNHMALHRKKRAYQAQCWAMACSQARPSATPPERVAIKVVMHMVHLRDEDGLTGSTKLLLDALKQKQIGQYGKPPKLDWRSGICPTWGFYLDDSPDLLSLTVEQVRVRKRDEERLELTITPVAENAP